MLHPMHALKAENIDAPYNSEWYSQPMREFIQSLPGGRDQYLTAIASAYSGLYASILEEKDKQLFLDKTPRYYLIIKELFEHFPQARFIFLFRNPAAVVASMTATWVQDDYSVLSNYRADLLEANLLMIKGIEIVGDRGHSVKYEDLVTRPDVELQNICGFLGIPFEKDMKNYGEIKDKWTYGDQNTLYKHTEIVSDYVNSWAALVKHPQVWHITKDYIHMLGAELIQKMGYSFNEIRSLLEANTPQPSTEQNNYPLALLLEKPSNSNPDYKLFYEKYKELGSTIETLKTEAARKDHELEEMRYEVDRMKQVVEAKTHELTESNKIIVEAQVQKQHLQNVLDEVKNDLANNTQQLNSYMEQLQAHEERCIELTKHLQATEQALAESRMTLQVIQKSITFRLCSALTYPGRKIRKLMS